MSYLISMLKRLSRHRRDSWTGGLQQLKSCHVPALFSWCAVQSCCGALLAMPSSQHNARNKATDVGRPCFYLSAGGRGYWRDAEPHVPILPAHPPAAGPHAAAGAAVSVQGTRYEQA